MPYERVWDEDGGSSWIPSTVAYENTQANHMQLESEDEIAAAAFDDAGWASDPATAGASQVDSRAENDELVESQSEITGFDGRPLGLDEIAHANIHGHGDWDRPIEIESMEQAADTIEELQQQLAADRAAMDRMSMGSTDMVLPIDQQRSAAREAAKSALIDKGVYLLDAEYEQVLTNQENQAIERQFMQSRIKHGEDFDEAYAALTSLNPNNPRDRAVARQIAYAGHAGAHAGETLMQWFGNSRATRQGRPHPRQQQHPMRDNPQSRQRSRPMEDAISDAGGVSSPEDERDIYASAWED